MRYADRINFISETGGGFNPETGNHDEPTTTTDTKACNISTLGIKRSVELFGEIDTSVIVVRLQRPYKKKFSYANVPSGQYKGNYRIREQVKHRSKTVFYLEGIA